MAWVETALNGDSVIPSNINKSLLRSGLQFPVLLCLSSNRLESNTEHWHALLLSLREIIEWVIRKDTELSSLGPLSGDVYGLQKQMVSKLLVFQPHKWRLNRFYFQDDHRTFRRELDAKRPVVETNLISGRQHVANEPPVSDASDNEGKKWLEFGWNLLTWNP